MVETLRSKFVVLRPILDERARRLWAAAEARAIGRGGIARVAEATGMSRGTVRAGLKELESQAAPEGADAMPSGRRRRPGGGRKRVTDLDPDLEAALERQLEPVTRGDPETPLRWTCNSAARLAERLAAEGHPVSERTVNRLLHALGYSLQGNRKTLEGRQHPDRDTRFRRIDRRVRAFQRLGQPVVSVDTKQKEIVGQYRHGGQEWRPKGEPEAVKVQTSRIRTSARPSPAECTTSPPMPDGSASGSITTPRPSQSRPCAAGGDTWADRSIPTPDAC